MLFRRKLVDKKIGISQNEKYFCIIIKQNQKLKLKWYKKSEFSLNNLLSKIAEKNVNAYKIFAINDHFIWRKYCFFPKDYTKEVLHRQILEILKQELPTSIENIYFDYQIFSQPKSEVNKIILYALIKNNQIALNIDNSTILDSEAYCYKRGLDYLFQLDEQETGYLFKDYILQFKAQEYCQTHIEHQAKITDCKRLYFLKNLQKDPKLNACENIGLSITQDQEMIDETLYITALGATLWNGQG